MAEVKWKYGIAYLHRIDGIPIRDLHESALRIVTEIQQRVHYDGRGYNRKRVKDKFPITFQHVSTALRRLLSIVYQREEAYREKKRKNPHQTSGKSM